jgi:hypothetical protein
MVITWLAIATGSAALAELLYLVVRWALGS